MNSPQPPALSLFGSLLSSFSRSRRLEDRIRQLSSQAVATTDPVEAHRILGELSAALRSHADRLREIASTGVLPRERRSQPSGQ
jgi:hypothetical protein